MSVFRGLGEPGMNERSGERDDFWYAEENEDTCLRSGWGLGFGEAMVTLCVREREKRRTVVVVVA
jgi:hypothetical protein